MISRGHFIGEIVDELSTISHQVATRSKLGLYDLNIYLENFFRDLLIATYGWQLRNINKDRSNEPGLDLVDDSLKLAVQVTSRSDLTKIHDTLKKLTPEQQKKYSIFYILIIGEKQRSYSLDETLCSKYNFDKQNILDLRDLCRAALDLPIDKLQDLHKLVRTNVAKILIELELADPATGEFPTSGFAKWEVKPDPKVGSGQKFAEWYEQVAGKPLDSDELQHVRRDLLELGQKLRRLPRVTREFLVMLHERGGHRESKRFNEIYTRTIRLDVVEREFLGARQELNGEIDLLEKERFIDLDGDVPEEYGRPEIGMRIPVESEELSLSFLEYVESKELDLRAIFGQVDLSEF